mgnify:CR=1 FL=1
MVNFIAGIIVGFGVCSVLTFRLLALKAKQNKRPVIDKDGDIYWTSNEATK